MGLWGCSILGGWADCWSIRILHQSEVCNEQVTLPNQIASMVAYLPISLQVHSNLEMEQKQTHLPWNYTSPAQNFKDIPHILQPNINQKNFTIYPYIYILWHIIFWHTTYSHHHLKSPVHLKLQPKFQWKSWSERGSTARLGAWNGAWNPAVRWPHVVSKVYLGLQLTGAFYG